MTNRPRPAHAQGCPLNGDTGTFLHTTPLRDTSEPQATALCPKVPGMAFTSLPPELIAQILSSLPLSPSADRAKALRAASLVNHAWRELTQKELARHIMWSRVWPGRVDSLLGSPSAAGGLAAESITLRRAPAEELWALLEGIKAVGRLALHNSNEEDLLKGRYAEVPVGALGGLRGEWAERRSN